MDTAADRSEPAASTVRTDLPPGLTSARQARAAVRHALAAWGIDDPGGDAELLASELAANAAEHAGGPVTLALHRHSGPGGRPGITCEITDTAPRQPRRQQAGADAERGRGLAIISALADDYGVRPGPGGKTTWFTLTLADRIQDAARQPEPELEAGA
jgi:anti-sigma regulatory factor (Ser/Thr protein kinase)